MEPAIMLRMGIPHFPQNSIHLLNIGILEYDYNHYLLAHSGNQWFIAPDNGVLTLALHGFETQWYRFPIPQKAPFFTASEIFTTFCQKLVQGGFSVPVEFEAFDNPLRKIWNEPAYINGQMRLTVIYNDSHGNAYLNLDKIKFNEVVKDQKFKIKINRTDIIETISNHMFHANEATIMALWGYAELLKIAVYRGSAKRYLDLHVGRMIQMEIEKNDYQDRKNDLSNLIDKRI